jgi:hypothetical protein
MNPPNSPPAAFPPGGVPPAGAGVGDSREFLGLMAHILVHVGHSPRKLEKEFHEICAQLPEPSGERNPAHLNFLTGLPELIARWHGDAQFLDALGHPVPLPLRSSGISFSSLIEEVLPGEDPNAIVEALIRSRGIRRRGDCYLPTDRQLRYTGENGWAITLRALLGILRTVKYNVTCATEDSTIYERTATYPRFPVRALPIFHEWFKQYAKEFLWSVYRQMSRHAEAFVGSGPTTCLGVGLFGFEDPMVTGASDASTPPGGASPPDPRSGRTGGRRKREAR